MPLESFYILSVYNHKLVFYQNNLKQTNRKKSISGKQKEKDMWFCNLFYK